MDAYEVHKKIQETIMLVDLYQMQRFPSSQWDAVIAKGLKELNERARHHFSSSRRNMSDLQRFYDGGSNRHSEKG